METVIIKYIREEIDIASRYVTGTTSTFVLGQIIDKLYFWKCLITFELFGLLSGPFIFNHNNVGKEVQSRTIGMI